jgi:hypothetical protein
MSRIGSETQTNDVWRSPVELTERQAIPTEAAAQLGLQPGAPVEMETGASSLLRRPVKHLAMCTSNSTSVANWIAVPAAATPGRCGRAG